MAAQAKPSSQQCQRVPAFGKAATILVVDDDFAVGELLRTVLNAMPGWGAVVVHDAAAARAVFAHVPVNLLVLDVNLPAISGPELLRLLRREAEWNDPPVLLTSADASQPLVQRALERGEVDEFLAKPLDVDEFLAAVRALLEAPPERRRREARARNQRAGKGRSTAA